MPHYVGTVHTNRSPEEVFDYLADFSSVEEWDPGVEEATALTAAPYEQGARFRVISRFLGRQVPLEYRTVEIEPPRRVVLRAETDSIVSLDRIDVRRAAEGGTTVTYDADLSLKGPFRLAELPMRLAFRRIGDRARAGLREALGR